MKAKLVFDDWRQVGVIGSIYQSELGVGLSLDDLHSGTTFTVDVNFDDPEVERNLMERWQKDGAYAVFALLPIKKETEETKHVFLSL